MKVNLIEDKLAMWIVCKAIGKECHKTDDFDNTHKGWHDVVLTVDGVELNILNVARGIQQNYNDAVKKAAGKMYTERFDSRADEITDELEKIAERLRYIRNNKFPEIDWPYC